ncbi:MAG TPA: hypothetical protein VJS30_15355 [Paraburkholderia sp.]|nr:hypothetical protein [Paraburkholderia sp.]
MLLRRGEAQMRFSVAEAALLQSKLAAAAIPGASSAPVNASILNMECEIIRFMAFHLEEVFCTVRSFAMLCPYAFVRLPETGSSMNAIPKTGAACG